MFTRVQAKSFRCLKVIDQKLGGFNALVGPNASGKTTFLDVIGLLSDIIRQRGDVLAAIQSRSNTFEKLLWMGRGKAFQLALEAKIPEAIRREMAEENQIFDQVRYEVEIGLDPDSDEIGFNHEALWLLKPSRATPAQPIQRDLFPEVREDASSILIKPGSSRKAAITKKPGGNDNYYPEGKKSYNPSFKLGRTKSALAHISADQESFPVSSWFKDLLERGVQSFVLNSQIIKMPSKPGLTKRFQTDGSNLPWVIAELRQAAGRFQAWLDHVRTALDDIEDIDTIERPEDKHRYLVIRYRNGAIVPSWLVSDGTLRLLALTIPAYLSGINGTFLIEEPENGIHPRAIETVLQSLSSMYDGQVLMATHSLVALNMLEVGNVLCFAKDAEGATDIVSGDKHPALRTWKKGEPDLGILFASGILS